jgi:hypothetical protein
MANSYMGFLDSRGAFAQNLHRNKAVISQGFRMQAA